MPRQEEMEIALRDSISPGLKAIARELKALNQAAREAASGTTQELDNIEKRTKNLSESSRQTMRNMQEMFSRVLDYGKAIVGIGGTVEAVKQLTQSLTELAETRVQLEMFSLDTRIGAQDIDTMRNAMERMGIEAKQADQYIAAMSDKLQELNAMREGSPLFQELLKMPGGAAFGQRLLAIPQGPDQVKQQIKMIVDTIKDESPGVQFVIAKMFGIPQSVLISWDEYMDKAQRVLRVPPEVAKAYYDNLKDVQDKIDDEWKLFGAHAMEAINKWFNDLKGVGDQHKDDHPISNFFIGEFDGITKAIQGTVEEIKWFKQTLQDVVDWWRPDLKKGREDVERTGEPGSPYYGPAAPKGKPGAGVGTGAGGESGAAIADEVRRQEETNKLLDSIRQSLEREGTAGYGVGLRHPGGAMQARVGGFRPMRGARGGGGRGAGGTDEGPVGPATGALADRIGEAKRAFEEQLRKEGVPEANVKEAANLLAGQALAESSMNPRTSHDQGTGYGIYGARLERRAAMLAWMKANGYAPDSLEGQAKFMAHEAMSSAYPRTRGALMGADPASRSERTDAITREFERPAVINPRTRQVDRAAATTMDEYQKRDMWKEGTAEVRVDFGDTKERNKESKPDGGVFKPLNNEREPQSPKSGNPATFSDRWYFQ